MTYLLRRLLYASMGAVLLLALLCVFPLASASPAQATSLDQSSSQSALVSTNYTFYGSNHSWMLTATNDWYQHQGNWCGIANIRAIQIYDWLYYNGKSPGWDNSQEAIHNRLNSYSSPWGHGPGGYVQSDISSDFGTDPHSIGVARCASSLSERKSAHGPDSEHLVSAR